MKLRVTMKDPDTLDDAICDAKRDIKKRLISDLGLTEKGAEAEAQQKVDLLKKEKEFRTPDKSLAIIIHYKTCTWNHTDGCGWFYEVKNGVPDWNGDAHAKYLRKARNILRKCEEINVDYEKTVDLLRVIYA